MGQPETVFQAKVITISNTADAINMAGITDQTIVMQSEVKYSYKALECLIVKQRFVGNCINILNILGQNKQVIIIWVPGPGHYRIEGNEKVDRLANK